jgi:hypothetical protein
MQFQNHQMDSTSKVASIRKIKQSFNQENQGSDFSGFFNALGMTLLFYLPL